MSVVRSVIAKKQLVNSLLDEISSNVVPVRNEFSSIRGKTFFEKCNNLFQDVSNLRVLIHQAYVLVPGIISKLTIDLQIWQGIMVDYEANN